MVSGSYTKIFYTLSFGGKRWRVCIPLLTVNYQDAFQEGLAFYELGAGRKTLRTCIDCPGAHRVLCLSFPEQIKSQTGLGDP